LVGVAVGLSAVTAATSAQTFKPVLNPSRITRAEVGHVIGAPGSGRTYVNYGGSGKTHRFIADGSWHRILILREGEWFRDFNNAGYPGGALLAPSDIDISSGGTVYIADRGNGRILAAGFNGDYITPAVGSFSTPTMAPVAVAWDGGSSPIGPSAREDLYVVDAAQARITYWKASGGSWTLAWTYGSPGSGTGQFRQPSGVCVSRGAGTPTGTSGFGVDFYVADAGNGRIVWLRRSTAVPPTAPQWMGEHTLPEMVNGWEPTACTVDHFGVVYVTDRRNSQIVSYTRFLNQITRYGTFGTGASNLNTFARPHAISVPFARSPSGNWVGEGRILTGEAFGSGSGGVSHWLGVEIPTPTGIVTATPSGWGPVVDFRTTGMAYNTVQVHRGAHGGSDAWVNTAWDSYLRSPGWQSAQWDGYTAEGLYAAPGQYHFHVTAISAYGCAGQAWCAVTRVSNAVTWDGPAYQGCDCPPDEICLPCVLNVALPLEDGAVSGVLPRAFRLGQVLTSYSGPLLRLDGIAPGASAVGGMTAADAVASVRAQGIRALAVDVPPGGAGRVQVSVRLYTLTGRMVRRLVDETVDPGSYVVGWDGKDENGRQVQDGVYIAVMTAGTYRGVQRLLLK
jgi:hypothetical protein